MVPTHNKRVINSIHSWVLKIAPNKTNRIEQNKQSMGHVLVAVDVHHWPQTTVEKPGVYNSTLGLKITGEYKQYKISTLSSWI